MENLEIKARCIDLQQAKRLALAGGALEHESIEQIDTYFVVPRGRLKLREIVGRASQLIAYHRADHVEARKSEYTLMQVSDPAALKTILALTLGVRGEVRKHREVLLWKNVRIHLDNVEQLGTFIELEAVISTDQDRLDATGHVEHLRSLLRIEQHDLIDRSYCDLSGI